MVSRATRRFAICIEVSCTIERTGIVPEIYTTS